MIAFATGVTPASAPAGSARAPDPPAMDVYNQATWNGWLARRTYRRLDGYFDAGERAALACAFADRPPPRALDVGVGAGRTTPLVAGRASAYVGVDYVAAMVAAARARWPGQRFEHADARDLSRFADGAFDLALFSCNGLDSIDPEGRRQALGEIARVLAPGGRFVVSTFNREAAAFGRRGVNRRIARTVHPGRLLWSLGKYLAGAALGGWRVARWRRLERHASDYALLLHRSHDYGVLVYATTPRAFCAQMRAAGLTPHDLFGASGRPLPRPLDAGGDAGAPARDKRYRDEEYFYVVAEKATGGAPAA